MKVDRSAEHSSQSSAVTNASVKVCKNPGCGNPLLAPSRRGGRTAEFCSSRCRMAVHRARHQPTTADLRYDALELYRRLEVPRYMGQALEAVPAEQLPDLLSFLRTATAGLAGVRAILEAAAGAEPDGRPKPVLVERTVTAPRTAPEATVTAPAVTEPDAAAAAAIADCFWCDENGMLEDADGDLVPCAHDDSAEQRHSAPARTPEPAAAAPSTARSKPAPARRPAIAGLRSTAEQGAIIDACVSGVDLVVEAGAGTGKTSTLKMVGHAMKGRGLYLAFNKAIATEAARSFPPAVTCKTAHSLAYAAVGSRYRRRMDNQARISARHVADALGLDEQLKIRDTILTSEKLARLATEGVAKFCYSADTEVQAHHIPVPDGLSRRETEDLRALVLPYARLAWADVQKEDGGKLRFTHDHYLKMWALTNPRLKADYVLLDEAQDSNPVIAHLVQSQTAQRIAVGDPAQSIYEWRGAIDAMETWPGNTRLILSESFRFGPQIAAEANKWLTLLNSGLRLTGAGQAGRVTETGTGGRAVLCRTNAEAMRRALAHLAGGGRPHLVGGGAQIRELAKAALTLMAGKGTTHPELLAFKTWDELKQYVNEEEAGADLATFVRLITTHGAQAVIDATDRLVEEPHADLVLSTVHKAKGREWDSVLIADDFPEPKEGPLGVVPPKKADLRLIYVAVTRAKYHLDRFGVAYVDELAGVRTSRDDGGW